MFNRNARHAESVGMYRRYITVVSTDYVHLRYGVTTYRVTIQLVGCLSCFQTLLSGLRRVNSGGGREFMPPLGVLIGGFKPNERRKVRAKQDHLNLIIAELEGG